MRRVTITFRELLERILPLGQLSPTELARVKDALARGNPGELERLAFPLLSRLSALGAVRSLPERVEGSERVVRFELGDTLGVVAFRFPVPALPAGIVSYPRAFVTARATAQASKLEPLLALDQALIKDDTRMPSGRGEMVVSLLRAATELLDADSVAFYPSRKTADAHGESLPAPDEPSLLAPWLADTVSSRNQLLLSPDTARAPEIAEAAKARGIGSLAAVRVRSEQAAVSGTLEVRSSRPGFFDLERLSLLSLLADSFDGLLAQAAHLQRLVYVDPLTKVFNRSFFQREIGAEVARARREGKSFALSIVDVDDFKRVNTMFGYEAGNEVLAEMADLLKSGLRPFDSVARWGGEEFALLLAAPVGRDDAEAIADRLRIAVAEHLFPVTGLDKRTSELSLTVSMGVALFPLDAETPEDLWRFANKALLVAKQPPKNRIVFFSELLNGPEPA
ncbi:MAG TPA: GGDEF domain-containing protein [Candidatus Eisenbacteria bacterium]|nr:GGDEF domain-containing protein [Candidatus Eisenbacteria bacterium]